MGFDINGARLLVKAKSLGVDFSQVATLGRQGLHLSAHDLQKIFDENGMDAYSAADILSARAGYAEPLLAALGAKVSESIDASDYEHASIVHDMNLPIPEGMRGRYSLVIDGGTLEHVFNFPVAIRNCLQLVKLGGFFIGITPANNFFGHGFYQFSPELYFRVFSEENGYEVKRMLFYADSRNARVYDVADPKAVGRRVLLRNSQPSYLFVIAQRVQERPLFAHPPQQSDYEQFSWRARAAPGQNRAAAVSRAVKGMLPGRMRRTASSAAAYLLAVLRPTGTGKSAFFRRTEL